MERRLAAILAADVVGYSRLTDLDEAGTLQRLRCIRMELVEPKITEHRGRVAKVMGDGLLAEFPSAVEAVRCAVELQDAISAREAGTPAEERIRIRIGINLGDVIVEGADVYGNGVNVAARLEALADPGGICISGSVFEMIDGRLRSRFDDAGEHGLKNIPTPIRVFQLAAQRLPEAEPSVDAPAQSTGAPPSIAVLPFENMSGDPSEAYFSDGITEDIITELSRFRDLSVVSRNSSFSFRSTNAPASEIATKLGVHYVVEGSIRKAANRVRVTAQLIDARTDRHIWAERYDRDLEDVFELQDDVVQRIAGTLVGRLEHERYERARRQAPGELRAYDLYLRGRESFFNWSFADNLAARDFLEAAVEVEPDYAAALALLSETVLRMFLNGWSEDDDDNLSRALELAQRAVEVDDQDSRVHMALGMAYIFHRDLDRARHYFETALRLNPNDTRVLAYYSRQAVLAGDTDEAIALCRRAKTRNPYGKYGWNLGIAYFAAHEYARGIEEIETIRKPPMAPLSILAACHAMLGNEMRAAQARDAFFAAARECAGTSGFTHPAEWRDFFAARWPFSSPERLTHLLEALNRAGIRAQE